MDLINILLFGIILLVAFGDYLITKFKRKSEEKILIGDEKAKHKKPFLIFLSSSTFIVFSSLTLILIIYVVTDLSSDLLPDLYFPEVLIAISFVTFYTIFSVKTYMAKVTKKKIIAREILYFTLNIFIGLILGSSFVLIQASFERSESKLEFDYKKAVDFEISLHNIDNRLYVKSDSLELAKKNGFEIINEINLLENIHFSFFRDLKGSYPNYYSKIESLRYHNLENKFELSNVRKDPRYIKSVTSYLSKELRFYEYLGKINIKKIKPEYEYEKPPNQYNIYTFSKKRPPPSNSSFFEYAGYDTAMSTSSGWTTYDSYYKFIGGKGNYYFSEETLRRFERVFGDYLTISAGGKKYRNVVNPFSTLKKLCRTWECYKGGNVLVGYSIDLNKTPTKNVELLKYLKSQPRIINKQPSDLYSDFINEDNLKDWFKSITYYQIKRKSSDIKSQIESIQKSFVSKNSKSVVYVGGSKSYTYKSLWPLAFKITFLFAYAYRILISILIFILLGYKWAFKTYFD